MWTHISDSRPFNGQYVAVTVGHSAMVCEYDDGMFYDFSTDDIYLDDEIDYWHPIPDLPEPTEIQPPPVQMYDAMLYQLITEFFFVGGEIFEINLN